ncbi:MAG: STAS domain-containing protein [Armatimonadota bacterium]
MMTRLEIPATGVERPPAVLAIEDESIDTANSWEVRAELIRVLHTQGPSLIVDLSGVSFMDSSGLGVLIHVLREARELGGDLCIRNPSREVRRILQVTGLLGVINEA